MAGVYVAGAPRGGVAMVAANGAGGTREAGGNNDATGGHANRKTNIISNEIQQVAQEIGRMIELAATPPLPDDEDGEAASKDGAEKGKEEL